MSTTYCRVPCEMSYSCQERGLVHQRSRVVQAMEETDEAPEALRNGPEPEVNNGLECKLSCTTSKVRSTCSQHCLTPSHNPSRSWRWGCCWA
jgi:hypothetical protein